MVWHVQPGLPRRRDQPLPRLTRLAARLDVPWRLRATRWPSPSWLLSFGLSFANGAWKLPVMRTVFHIGPIGSGSPVPVARKHFAGLALLGVLMVWFCATCRADGPEPATKAPEHTVSLPAAVDLRPAFKKWGLVTRVQGNRPTCSAFTLTGGIEFAVASQQGQGTPLSVEFLNWAMNQSLHANQDGGFFSDLWQGFANYGICADQELAYRPKFDPSPAPSAAALASAKSRLALGLQLHWIKPWNVETGLSSSEFDQIKQRLALGWPVCGGFRWPKHETWDNDVLGMCGPDAVRDGHSVLLVGYRDDAAQPGGGVLVFRNSAHGGRDGYMPYAYARQYMNDAVWIDPIGAQAPTRKE